MPKLSLNFVPFFALAGVVQGAEIPVDSQLVIRAQQIQTIEASSSVFTGKVAIETQADQFGDLLAATAREFLKPVSVPSGTLTQLVRYSWLPKVKAARAYSVNRSAF